MDNEQDTNTNFVAMVGTECETVAASNTVSTGDYIVIEGQSLHIFRIDPFIIAKLTFSGSADACSSANLNSKYCGQKLNANTGVKFNSVVCGNYQSF